MFGDGSDGAITFSSNTQFNPPADAAVNSGPMGSTTLTVSGLTGVFQPGQAIMIHQTRGTGAGDWELNTVQTYALGNIVTVDALSHTYSTSGANAAQVLVVPEYTNVTVDPGVTVSAKPWDGAKGGILAFLANGTLTPSGTLSANGSGYRGGAGIPSSSCGQQGEGIPGIGVNCSSANGNGGGAGGDYQNTSGGGGGNGTAGSDGNSGPSSGVGGGTAGSTDLTNMVFGGGGGGTGNGAGPPAPVCSGGSGGGILTLFAANVVSTGSLTADGNNGDGSCGSGAGGGAGGSILVRSQTLTLGSSSFTATGGAGGPDDLHVGGPGGKGRIRVEYCTTISGGIADPPASIAQISCAPVDSDGDTIPDASDACPTGDTGWTSSAATDHDVDGCRDSTEDPDDDNDGVPDVSDACPTGDAAWTSTPATDRDGDGCRDTTEDPDDDGDGVADVSDGCPLGETEWTSSPATDHDGDGCRDSTEDSDDDNDLVGDTDEPPCGSNPLDNTKRPERLDGVFAGVSEDGDVDVDEALPSPASDGYDCDGDGYTGTDEAWVFAGGASTATDQDACGNNGWPSDLFSTGMSANLISTQDMGSFIAPVPHLGTSPGDPFYDVRWDLKPGVNFPFVGHISVADIGTMLTGTQGYPPMLGGAAAFGNPAGPVCPWPP